MTRTFLRNKRVELRKILDDIETERPDKFKSRFEQEVFETMVADINRARHALHAFWMEAPAEPVAPNLLDPHVTAGGTD